jgi:hypothetical protein
MSHARSSMWDRKPLPPWTEAQEKEWHRLQAVERLYDWLYVLQDHAEDWREFAP